MMGPWTASEFMIIRWLMMERLWSRRFLTGHRPVLVHGLGTPALEDDASWVHTGRTRKFCIWDSRPMYLLTCLVLIHILYNKTVIITIVFSWILWVLLANDQIWGSGGNPWICSQLVKSAGDVGTPCSAAGVWTCSEGSFIKDCSSPVAQTCIAVVERKKEFCGK